MMTSRPATPDEIEILQADLKRDRRWWEQVDLTKAVVMVVEKDGEIIQYGAARLTWQIEPLKFMHGARKTLTPIEQKKATYMLGRRMLDWLADTRNNPYIRSVWCHIVSRAMQKYCLRRPFEMIRIYKSGGFFGKDL